MSINRMTIREITRDDNRAVESIIKAAFPEFDLPLVGTAYEDVETTQMFESYRGDNEVYYVIEENDEVVGGAGIRKLANQNENICELQKMYFSPSVRGKGYGKVMFNKCLETAKALGYERCYLESASMLEAAIHIYEVNGFKHLDGPLGGTGHYSCGVWMIKDL